MKLQVLLLLKVCFFWIVLVTHAAAVQVTVLSYGPFEAQVLDLYTPDTRPTAAMPTVVLAHGGLWQSGGRSALARLCSNIVSRSGDRIACASIDYRLSQDLGGLCTDTGRKTYLDQVGDMALAYALLQGKSDSYDLDPGSMFIGGHSAGAHLSHIFNLRWAEFAKKCSHSKGCPAAVGAVGIEGIYNIPAWNDYDLVNWDGRFECATRKAFGAPGPTPQACLEVDSNERCWDMGSPIYLAKHAVRLGIVPAGDALLIHSTGDDWVDIAEAKNFGSALETAFPQIDVLTRIDGRCTIGQHNDTLGETALADCIIEFVVSR